MLHKLDLLTIGEVAQRSGVAPSALRYYETQGLITSTRTTATSAATSGRCCAGSGSSGRPSGWGSAWRRSPRRCNTLPGGRTPTKADWTRLSRQWRGRLNEQIERLERLRDRLDGCIGCGCLSLQRCTLQNPGDVRQCPRPGSGLSGAVRRLNRALAGPVARFRVGYRAWSTRLRCSPREDSPPACLPRSAGLIERYTETGARGRDHRLPIRLPGSAAGRLDRRDAAPYARTRPGLHAFGGSPIGNSRVKLTNAADLVKRGLVAEGVDPLQAAADRLTADGVDVLHTIGGDDTNTTAADLAALPGQQRLHADRGRAAEDHRQRHHPDPAVAGRLDRGRAGRPVRAEHHRRAQLRLPDADRARGDGPALRLADGRHGAGLPGVAGHPGVAARDRAEPGGVGRARRLPAGGGLRPRGRGRPAEGGDGRVGSVNIFISEGAGLDTIVAELEQSGEEVPGIRSVTSRSTRSTRVPGSPASSPSGSAPRR